MLFNRIMTDNNHRPCCVIEIEVVRMWEDYWVYFACRESSIEFASHLVLHLGGILHLLALHLT